MQLETAVLAISLRDWIILRKILFSSTYFRIASANLSNITTVKYLTYRKHSLLITTFLPRQNGSKFVAKSARFNIDHF